jgi:hypothetical protein
MPPTPNSPEHQRLEEDTQRKANWKRWGPYLSERQWGTVREDYSADGDCWDYFPHDHARSRAYRWGEDGLLGITDRECRLSFALALWNGQDPILKERLFGLSNPEGNHGEDVKELYYYLDSTPTHSYMKALYKYPQMAFPYNLLVEANRKRSRQDPELELCDIGAFDHGHYYDVFAEYAKAGPDDILIRITIINHAPTTQTLHVLPTLWFRNTWSWGCEEEDCWIKPRMWLEDSATIATQHATLEPMLFHTECPPHASQCEILFTENETDNKRIFHSANPSPYVKDAFHRYVIDGDIAAVNPDNEGTKAAVHYELVIPPNGRQVLRFRLSAKSANVIDPLGPEFDRVFKDRIAEADEFYDTVAPPGANAEQRNVLRQAYAGLLWSKQYYHYVVKVWLEGDPVPPKPPERRRFGRNCDWEHLYNRDVISMPDKWEYPWYAAWDLAFHMVPMAAVDPSFAKEQLLLMLREWYMHPNGQLPAYEFNFSDVNPPVHAWACWRVYKMTGPRGQRDQVFLARCFQKLLINFTWWVNRKDEFGKHVFSGGFLGLDNIGILDRSQPLPEGGHLEQADGTAWMAFYCATMLSMAMELAIHDPSYEDVASKFFEHFVAIADAINTLGGSGLWNEEDGFYYDQLHIDGHTVPMKIRSMVGLIPLFAVEVLDEAQIQRLPGFRKRMAWFMEHRKDLSRHISYLEHRGAEGRGDSARGGRYLLAIPSRERLERVLKYALNEAEFLSPHGLRSLSAYYRDHSYELDLAGQKYCIRYAPGESDTGMFGGNSNWRGPVWFPLNYLLIESLERYHHFYGDSFKIEHPAGSGRFLTLKQVAAHLSSRMVKLFLPDKQGRRPAHGNSDRYSADPAFKDLVLFYEYFHGDTGAGLGASHQTGWTALVTRMLHVAQPKLAATSQSALPVSPPALSAR